MSTGGRARYSTCRIRKSEEEDEGKETKENERERQKKLSKSLCVYVRRIARKVNDNRAFIL
jgi:hypothetical protein